MSLTIHGATPEAEIRDNKISEDSSNADDVGDSIARQRSLGSHFPNRTPTWLESFRDTRNDWSERLRLETGATYDVAGMASFGYDGPVYGLSGDLTVSGIWHLAGEKRNIPLDLRFRFRGRHAIGNRAASDVSDASGGVFWNMIDGFSDAGFEVPDFQLVQHFPKHGLEIRYGQMTIDSQFDRHALRSSKQAFFNRAFSANPAVAFPSFGSGATLVWKPESHHFDLSLGATTVQGTQNGSQVDLDFGSSDFFTAFQLGHDFEIGDNPARIQTLIWHSDSVKDANTPEGMGISLTYEHWLASNTTRLFVRAAWADSEASDTDRLISAGFALERCENDLLGFAIGTGRDSSGSDEWQAVVETFYRRQIGPSFRVTPEAQLIFGSGLDDHPIRFVLGLRAEVSF